MEDIVFKTDLSMKEIAKIFTGMDFFAALIASLKDALRFSRFENGCQKILEKVKQTETGGI